MLKKSGLILKVQWQQCHPRAISVHSLCAVSMLIGIFILETSAFEFHFLNKLLLRNCAVNFVEICKVCARKAVIKAAKRIINSDKMCRNYSNLNFGVTFLEHSVDRKSAISLQRGQFDPKFQIEGVTPQQLF